MSRLLRQAATDKLKRDYDALSTLCQTQVLSQMDSGLEKGGVEDILGSEDTFRTNMEDEKYRKLVEFLIKITQSEPHHNYLHF
tara:strand:- start:368 stop:616 length:249 start_codon:yes stop_codon:yes gene_type:complete